MFKFSRIRMSHCSGGRGGVTRTAPVVVVQTGFGAGTGDHVSLGLAGEKCISTAVVACAIEGFIAVGSETSSILMRLGLLGALTGQLASEGAWFASKHTS